MSSSSRKRTKSRREDVVSVNPTTGKLFAVESGRPLLHCIDPPVHEDSFYANGFDCDACGRGFDPEPFWHTTGFDCCNRCATEAFEKYEASAKREGSTASSVAQGLVGSRSRRPPSVAATGNGANTKMKSVSALPSAKKSTARTAASNGSRNQSTVAKEKKEIKEEGDEQDNDVVREDVWLRNIQLSPETRVGQVLLPGVSDVLAAPALIMGYVIEANIRGVLSLEESTGLTSSCLIDSSGGRSWLVTSTSPVMLKHLKALGLPSSRSSSIARGLSDTVTVQPFKSSKGSFAVGTVPAPLRAEYNFLFSATPEYHATRRSQSRSSSAGVRDWIEMPFRRITQRQPAAGGGVPTAVLACSLELLKNAPLDPGTDSGQIGGSLDPVVANPHLQCFFLSDGSVQVVDLLQRTEVLFMEDEEEALPICGKPSPDEIAMLLDYAQKVLKALIARFKVK